MVLLDTSGLWDRLQYYDAALFTKINGVWTNAVFDWLMPILRQPAVWIPLYIFIAIVVFYKLGWRQAVIWMIFAGLAPAIGDLVSSHVIKEAVGRVRPCSEPALAATFRNIIHHCGGNGSFTSSHATNHFAMAAYFFFTGQQYFKKWRRLFFIWAAAICYAQVYVGVHYPGDVLGGAVLGLLIGGGLAVLYNRRLAARFLQ